MRYQKTTHISWNVYGCVLLGELVMHLALWFILIIVQMQDLRIVNHVKD